MKQNRLSSSAGSESRLLYELTNYLSWSGLSDPEHQVRLIVIVVIAVGNVVVVVAAAVVAVFVSFVSLLFSCWCFANVVVVVNTFVFVVGSVILS